MVQNTKTGGNFTKKIGNAFGKVGKTLNPMEHLINNKKTRNVMKSTGEITNDYLLPATVQLGKPVYDATAMTASTLLTGTPIPGKMVADTLFSEMVVKKNSDLRKNQKSKELGQISNITGNIIANKIGNGIKTKNNKWIEYVKNTQRKCNCSYKEALKLSSKTYKK
jgi:hypothetical protein